MVHLSLHLSLRHFFSGSFCLPEKECRFYDNIYQYLFACIVCVVQIPSFGAPNLKYVLVKFCLRQLRQLSKTLT